MNLERLPNEEKLSLCRKYYLGETALSLSSICSHFHLSFNIVMYYSVTITINIFLLFCIGGFAFLPFLWLVNVVWFFREAFIKPTYTEQLQIKTCKFEQNGKNSIIYFFYIFKFI